MAQSAIYLLLLSTSLFYCTIANEVTIEFNMNDRQVAENQGPCDVKLIKTGKLSEDIDVRVRALTIEQYENLTRLTFNETVPHAEVDDFVAYDEMFTFEEVGDFKQEKQIDVEIVDDNVNEAPEEFLLYLNIQNSDTVDTIITRVDRNPTRCRIMNDDALKIGFESSAYTVPEGSDLNDYVDIIKQDGTSTEEDIELEITAVSRSAKLGDDFTTPNGDRTFSIIFPASWSRISVPIQVLSNSVSEGSRNFVLIFSASGVDKDITIADITIEDTTPPSPEPTSTSSPTPTSTPFSPSSSSPSPSPSSTPPVLPPPVLTIIPAPSNVPQRTNIPQEGGDPDCDEEKDLGLAIGLTFLLTFLLTALCAAVIIVFVVIADRKRRDRHAYAQQQLS